MTVSLSIPEAGSRRPASRHVRYNTVLQADGRRASECQVAAAPRCRSVDGAAARFPAAPAAEHWPLGNIPPRPIEVNDLPAKIPTGFARPSFLCPSPGHHRGISSPGRGPIGAPTARRRAPGRSPTAVATRGIDSFAGAAATAPVRCGVRAASDRSATIGFNGPASRGFGSALGPPAGRFRRGFPLPVCAPHPGCCLTRAEPV